MCNLATEIQHQWQQAYGDFYTAENGRIDCWIPQRRKSVAVRKGFGVCSQNDVIRIVKYVWLPRQDQLIEMAQENGRRYESVTQEFFNWAKTAYGLKRRASRQTFPDHGKDLAGICHAQKLLEKMGRLRVVEEIYSRPRQGA